MYIYVNICKIYVKSILLLVIWSAVFNINVQELSLKDVRIIDRTNKCEWINPLQEKWKYQCGNTGDLKFTAYFHVWINHLLPAR